MTQQPAREPIGVQTNLGGAHYGNTMRLAVHAIDKDDGQVYVDELIRELHLKKRVRAEARRIFQQRL